MFCCLFKILNAQQIDILQLKTFAKENPIATFRCRAPAKYQADSVVRYRLLVYFGGRNTTGEWEIKNRTWTVWRSLNER